jgi:hypothetical protein
MINNTKEKHKMAFSSIARMTVPVSSDGTGDAQGILMPKLQYRFRILFENFGVSKPTTELTKQVMDFTRPQIGFGEIPLEVYNSRIYLAAKPTWESVTVNLRDDVSGEVTRRVGEQIQKQFDFSEQASAAAGSDYKFKMVCQILDGARGVATPNILEAWEMYGCYIVTANYGPLNYGASEPATIALTIRFDNAVQTPLDGDGPAYGVGKAVGRGLGSNVSGIGNPSSRQT